MARSATTLDAFSAVGEPMRRKVLGLLAERESAVNDMVESLGWSQPMVSKHLAVLLQVGLVNVRREGRQRFYSVNGMQLKTIHDWTGSFEKLWDHQLARIKQVAEAKERLAASLKSHKPKE